MLGYWLHRELYGVVRESFRARAVAATEDLGHPLSLYVAYEDAEGIPESEMVSGLLAREDTVHIRVMDEAGSVLFERLGPAGTPAGLAAATLRPVEEATSRMTGPDRMEVAVPIMASAAAGPDGGLLDDGWLHPEAAGLLPPDPSRQEQVGTLVIGYRMAGLLEGERRALLAALLAAVAIVVLGILFSVFLGRSLGQSISRISSRAESLARGEVLQEPIPEEGRGEILDLCRAFNLMSQAIREREEQLRQESQRLEREVEARTRELRAEALRLENANDLLTLQNQRVKEADRAKSAFLATISHELRTPLNSIIGFTDLLQQQVQGPLNDAQEEDVGTVHGAAQHLLALINDLLDLSKVEAGRMEIHPTRVQVEDFVSRLRAVASGLPTHPDVCFELQVEDDVPSPWADPKRLHQVVLNLVSNALKFTERGSVEVVLGCGEDGRFELTVRDSGPGIPEEARERIFEPFGQVDQTAARQQQGTGLGLTISRQLVELMGGELTLVSRLGEGSTFRLRIPTEPPGETEEREGEP